MAGGLGKRKLWRGMRLKARKTQEPRVAFLGGAKKLTR
jgi:hypothetical protein